MDPREIGRIFRSLDRELWIITAADETRCAGLVATFVAPASIVPEMPRVLVGLARQHQTWELVEAADAFAMHLVGSEDAELIWRFGLQSGREVDKFAGLDIERGITGAPLLNSTVAWLECRVESRLETGDRTVYLGEVIAGGVRNALTPLTMQRLVAEAAPERLAALKEQLVRDAELDARAIAQWQQGFNRS